MELTFFNFFSTFRSNLILCNGSVTFGSLLIMIGGALSWWNWWLHMNPGHQKLACRIGSRNVSTRRKPT